MICLPLSAETNIELVNLLSQAQSQPADLIELRLDFLKEPPDFSRLIPAHVPLVVSCRSRADGGVFDGTEIERRGILRQAIDAGCAYIEAEAVDINSIAPHKKQATLIACFHDFEGTPDDLESRIEHLAALPADWVKFAVTYQKPQDSLRVLKIIKNSPKTTIGIAMGEGGLITRILGPAMGSPVTYANRDPGFEAAPGTPTASDLAQIYRINEITTDTKVYGLIGNPILHSRVYRLINRAFAFLDIDAVFIPLMCENAADFLNTFTKAINLQGLSVTIPHKTTVMRWADVRTANAQHLGSANILTLSKAGWVADNTDLSGAFESLKSAVDNLALNLTNANALILGAGGTTAAVATALSLLGCKITIAARNADAAWRIAAPMDWDVEDIPSAVKSHWDVVANTTPVGMFPNVDESLFPAENWRSDMLAFDVVFNPGQTKFLKEAAAADAVTVDGIDMFLRQTAEQFRLWTGKQMPRITSLTWGVR